MNRLQKRGDIYPRGVLQVCLDVHMRHTGAAECDQTQQDNDIQLLTVVLNTWDKSSLDSLEFDEAVRNLVIVTLMEQQ